MKRNLIDMDGHGRKRVPHGDGHDADPRGAALPPL